MNELTFITILVNHMDKALEFYVERLGFDIVKKDHYPNFVLVQQESFLIALHSVEDIEKVESRVIPGITVQDLVKTLERLNTNGVNVIHNTPQKFFGGMYAGIYDPSGNMLELIEWESAQREIYGFKK